MQVETDNSRCGGRAAAIAKPRTSAGAGPILKSGNTPVTTLHALRLLFSVAALSVPASLAWGFALGNMEVRSHIGQNFEGQVSFVLGPGEDVEESCFRLTSSQQEDGIVTLTDGTLRINPGSRSGTLSIIGRQPANEPILKIILQVNCAGAAQLRREYVVLLDPPQRDESPAAARNTTARDAQTRARDVPTAGESPAAPPVARKRPRAVSPQVDGRSAAIVPRPARPVARNESARRAVQAAPVDGFRLKLSVGAIDLSASEKMTEQERAQLREKQLLLDVDDQVSNLLSLKNSVKQLETRIAEMQSQLAAAKPATNVPPTATEPVPPAIAAPKPQPAPVAVSKSVAPVRDDSLWPNWPWYWWLLAVGAVFLIATLVRHRVTNSGGGAYEVNEAAAGPAPEKGAEEMLDLDFQAEKTPMVEKTAPTGSAASVTAAPEPVVDPRDFHRRVLLSQFPELQGVENLEPATIGTVAQRYFRDKQGRAHAIELIEFGLEEHPDAEELWLTQFEFLHQDGRKTEFEQLTKRFHQRFPNSADWEDIQSAGRSLDPGNLLYGVPPAAKRAPTLDLDFDITGGHNPSPETTSNRPRAEAPAAPVADLSIPLDFSSVSEPADKADTGPKRTSRN